MSEACRKMDVRTLGQVFTPEWVVAKMLRLRRCAGRVLEPSAGDGAFLRQLESEAVGLEIDPLHINDTRIMHADFFAHGTQYKYNTIASNPPYVRFQDIRPTTKCRLDTTPFDRRTNLYMFFIWKAIDHLEDNGELIFITPRDFLKATSARQLNGRLHSEGSFTHFEELGDFPVFDGASPNCAIWRWQKGLRHGSIQDGRQCQFHDGQIWFGTGQSGCLRDHFEVKVGAVSGADHVFHNQRFGTVEMAGSQTRVTGIGKRMIYNRRHRHLEKHKSKLLSRSIRKFDESNWWEWGRKYPERPGQRIYVNTKTRNRRPFFVSSIEAFDGSLLALFPRIPDLDLVTATRELNAVDWNSMGFVCDGRYLFTQRSLASAPVHIP